MQNLGSRVDFHTHTIHSDGALLPGGLAYEAAARKHAAIAITDHVDASNIEDALPSLIRFIMDQGDSLPLKIIPGVEISYLDPKLIEKFSLRAQ